MKYIKLLLLILLTITSSTSFGNTIKFTSNPYSYGNGGEFSAYSSDNGNFTTFCVQHGVYFEYGRTYSYTLSNADSHGVRLATGTAFLFSHFTDGTLVGYDYLNPTERRADAGLLQSAIWAIQDGHSIANNPFYSYAQSSLGNSIFTPNNGQYDVQIVQLWDGEGEEHQNQLYCKVPDTADTLFLLCGAVGCVYLIHRRVKA